MYLLCYVVIIVIIIVLIIIASFMSLYYKDPYSVIKWWNNRIKEECDEMDKSVLTSIPSYHDSSNCPNSTARNLNHMIQLNHDTIVTEVTELMEHYSGLPMSDLDNAQNKWLAGDDKWRIIWVKFMGDWAGSANALPTLKNIASMFPDITVLNISILYPGAMLFPHQGPSRAVQRYHYGLRVPDGDVALKLDGHEVKWQEGEGFLWDDTLTHSAWNNTDEPRIIIFADIMRELSPINAFGSRLLYEIMQRTKHVSDITERLKREGIVVD